MLNGWRWLWPTLANPILASPILGQNSLTNLGQSIFWANPFLLCCCLVLVFVVGVVGVVAVVVSDACSTVCLSTAVKPTQVTGSN